MSWKTADVLSADTAEVLAADTTDALRADTTHVVPADITGVLSKNQKSCFQTVGLGLKKVESVYRRLDLITKHGRIIRDSI